MENLQSVVGVASKEVGGFPCVVGSRNERVRSQIEGSVINVRNSFQSEAGLLDTA